MIYQGMRKRLGGTTEEGRKEGEGRTQGEEGTCNNDGKIHSAVCSHFRNPSLQVGTYAILNVGDTGPEPQFFPGGIIRLNDVSPPRSQ